MLLCKKCGYQVQHKVGGILGEEVVCTHPDCSLSQRYTSESTEAEVKQFIEENCEVLQLSNVLDREGRIEDLLWWVRARKELMGLSNSVKQPAVPQLHTVTSAMEEVIASKAEQIVATLRLKQND